MKESPGAAMLRQNREALEHFILSSLSVPLSEKETEPYSISWEAAGTILDILDRAALAAWADDFVQRKQLLWSPVANGLSFSKGLSFSMSPDFSTGK